MIRPLYFRPLALLSRLIKVEVYLFSWAMGVRFKSIDNGVIRNLRGQI
jgi:hypothetical protein